MFYALDIKEGSLLYRRKLNKRPKVTEKHVQGGFPFCVIETCYYRKKLNWSEIEQICGRYKNRLLLTDNIERPESLPKPNCENFEKIIFANTIYEIIRRLNFKNKRLSMCIIDDGGLGSERLTLFVPLIPNLFVKTQRRDLYNPEIKKAMEEYGAKVRYTLDEKGEFILNLNREIFTVNLMSQKIDIKRGDSINLAYCYFSVCPNNVSRADFAAFLYNFSKVSSLNSLYFDDVITDTQKVKIKDAAKTLKRLCY